MQCHFFVFSRNKRKVCGKDEQLYNTDGVKIKNGLECKIACGSSKVTLLSPSPFHAYRLYEYIHERPAVESAFLKSHTGLLCIRNRRFVGAS